MLETGAAESGIARRPVLKGALAGAVVLAPLPFAVPLVGGLSDTWDVNRFRYTAWGEVPDGTGGRLPDGSLHLMTVLTPDNDVVRPPIVVRHERPVDQSLAGPHEVARDLRDVLEVGGLLELEVVAPRLHGHEVPGQDAAVRHLPDL